MELDPRDSTHTHAWTRVLSSLHSLLHFSHGEIILRDHSLQPLRVQTSGNFRLHQDTDDSRGSQKKIRNDLLRLIRGNWWLFFASLAAKEPRELESLLRYQDACLKLSDEPRELQRIFAKNVRAFHRCEIDGNVLGGNSSLHRRHCFPPRRRNCGNGGNSLCGALRRRRTQIPPVFGHVGNPAGIRHDGNRDCFRHPQTDLFGFPPSPK